MVHVSTKRRVNPGRTKQPSHGGEGSKTGESRAPRAEHRMRNHPLVGRRNTDVGGGGNGRGDSAVNRTVGQDLARIGWRKQRPPQPAIAPSVQGWLPKKSCRQRRVQCEQHLVNH